MKTFLMLLALSVIPFLGVIKAQSDYFQQKVAYEIHVTLDDQRHFLRGQETLVYTNNSPDVLNELYIHIWPNAYRDNTTAFARQKRESFSTRFEYADAENRGFIDSLTFEIDGEKVPWTFWQDNPDVAHVTLPQPLKPGQSLTFHTPFRVKIPDSFSRLGHIDQQYQLTQWFPKPAVYDQHGWNPIYYLDQGEFYSEFGSFDVYITLPGDYMVGATGDLPKNDPEWVWLAKRESLSRLLLRQDDLAEDSESLFPHDRAREMKTLHFHQENVHDFAWFCDKDYFILSDSVTLASGKKVRIVALFNQGEREFWKNDLDYLRNSVYYYSLWVGDYPYNHATAVDGALSAGAGMEYPNITVLGAGGSAESLDEVTAHEVGHNWFYGILGSDERTNPWMDEGINSYYENRYWIQTHGDTLGGEIYGIPKFLHLDLNHSSLQRYGYLLGAGENVDQPVTLTSEEFTNTNYGTMVYMKTARTFRYLEEMLGRDVFDRCMHAYFDQWKFRHPRPEDIKAVFEKTSGQDLGWFFDGLLPGKDKINFKLSGFRQGNLKVKNKSGIALPVSVTLYAKNDSVLQTLKTPVFSGKTQLSTKIPFHHAIVNSNQYLPEVRMGNNRLRAGGLFRQGRPLKFRFLYSLPSEKEFAVNYLPAVGYNTTDGFMLGALLHHNFFPSQAFSFHFMPMYGFKNKDLAGSAGLTFRWLPKTVFQKIEFHSRTSLFSNILRTHNYLEFTFMPRNLRQSWRQYLTLSLYHLGYRENGEYNFPGYQKPIFGQAVYLWTQRKLGVFKTIKMEAGGNVTVKSYRASVTGNYYGTFWRRNAFHLRLFAGGMVGDKPAPWLLQYRLSGSKDPFAQNILLDRWDNSTWLNQQVVRDHGAFRTLTGLSFDRFVVAANLDTQVPVSFLRWVRVFADVGYGRSYLPPGYPLQYDAGVAVHFFRDFLVVNLPVVGSVYGGAPADFRAFSNQINFSLDFARLKSFLPF
ncbi:MAG: M1 family metallopeptidase [Bacteroidia bacterium]|nr:M1 family metallopeptidase [Bacteroidia bacterium]